MQKFEEIVAGWFDKDRPIPEQLSEQIIGRGLRIPGPDGDNPIVYADYAASGRAFMPIERYLLDEVLPYYANPHTHASWCGQVVNALRSEARLAIRRCYNVPEGHAVVFTGSGATAGLNKLARLLAPKGSGIARPLVLLGPYEHHSNILPWRESAADIVTLEESGSGGPSLLQLEQLLEEHAPRRLVIGAFSAASNVTGITSDVPAITGLLKSHGALSIWDYAGGAPYLPIDVAEHGYDAAVISPHKFIGGPGASGLLILRETILRDATPSSPGGGTVSFVSPWTHHYAGSVVAREEAGTPNVLGDIKAALAIELKSFVGQDAIHAREAALNGWALERWAGHERLELLGNLSAKRIPIFSFRVRDGEGGYVHHQAVTRMLSDYHGVQARGGCACAGPYAHSLLGLTHTNSVWLQERLAQGHELDKPGWVRVNFSYALTDEEADRIILAVLDIAERGPELVGDYHCDPSAARFMHKCVDLPALRTV